MKNPIYNLIRIAKEHNQDRSYGDIIDNIRTSRDSTDKDIIAATNIVRRADDNRKNMKLGYIDERMWMMAINESELEVA